MMIFDENLDRSGLSDRDQSVWLRIRSKPKVLTVLGLVHKVGYMALAQAAQIYGGHPANARREIQANLVETGLLGQQEFNGNAYLHLRAPGARMVSAKLDDEGATAVPTKTWETLSIAFARVEWWLRNDGVWQIIPGASLPLGLADLPSELGRLEPVLLPSFRETLTFRSGVYCLATRFIEETYKPYICVLYLIIDLNRSRSAYRELFRRIEASARTLHSDARLWVRVTVGNEQREEEVARVLVDLPLKNPLVVDGETDRGDHLSIGDYEMDRYLTYGFQRKRRSS